MFGDLYNAVSVLWSWRWPVADGEITAVEVERIKHSEETDTTRLAVAYRFLVGDDGLYYGECFWTPVFSQGKRVTEARRKLRIRQKVRVRYRPDDPTVNRLLGGVKAQLGSK